jgi:tRNA(Ile)-lysidine synthase
VVDHGLQGGSADVAGRAAEQLLELGADTARVLTVAVSGSGGLEAAARRARYFALRSALPGPDTLVLLGHTRDDQAETVLLGLGRGSGPRSVAGMRTVDPPWGRPLLGVSRAMTAAACTALGLCPWSDPHNGDPRFARVRLRTEVLPLLETVLQGGVASALARTADQLREDLDVLDALADTLHTAAVVPAESGSSPPPPAESGSSTAQPGESHFQPQLLVDVLAEVPAPVRRRVLRRWLLEAGVTELTDSQIRSVDAMVAVWRGQGGVWLPGGLVARRAHGRLLVGREGCERVD